MKKIIVTFVFGVIVFVFGLVYACKAENHAGQGDGLMILIMGGCLICAAVLMNFIQEKRNKTCLW